MPVREPGWWYGADGDWRIGALDPVARLWGWVTARRMRRTEPARAGLPVICVGNFTAGGTGKTPLSIHIARLLQDRGERPVFLTRGYGGRKRGPHRVAPGLDTALDVGDEPLLLARQAPVIVARDRAAGARLAAGDAGNAAPSVIVMDDGLQNPALAKSLAIAVVDGRRGLGNGRVIPSGPLRAPLDLQLGLADAILVNRPPGPETDAKAGDVAALLRDRFNGPVLEARVAPDLAPDALAGVQVLALAGIANPQRFYALLGELGADVVRRAEFPDHHPFAARDATAVLADARRLGARIVTTEKDWVRLVGMSGALADLREQALVVPIRLALEPRDALRLASLVEAAIRRT